MAKEIYLGDVSNIARKVKKVYIGDANNIAREVKKGYIGDSNNLAREFYKPGFPIVSGSFDTVFTYTRVAIQVMTLTDVNNLISQGATKFSISITSTFSINAGSVSWIAWGAFKVDSSPQFLNDMIVREYVPNGSETFPFTHTISISDELLSSLTDGIWLEFITNSGRNYQATGSYTIQFS